MKFRAARVSIMHPEIHPISRDGIAVLCNQWQMSDLRRFAQRQFPQAGAALAGFMMEQQAAIRIAQPECVLVHGGDGGFTRLYGQFRWIFRHAKP